MNSPADSGIVDPLKNLSSNSSSRQTSGKPYVAADSSPARELDVKERILGGGDEEYDSIPLKRSLDSQERDDDPGKDDQDDAEYRRMRRRITNRESAKRMRIKRQEELANFQKELKRVSLENEQLRRYSAHLQKQHIMMATDVQHWQNKYASANTEVTALFQQLQQVVALSAAFNPAILDAVGKTASTGPAQGPVLNALMHALPQARILSEALEALRTTGAAASSLSLPTSFLAANSTASPVLGPTAGLTAAASLASTGPLSTANLTAIRLAAAAHAEARSGSSGLPRVGQDSISTGTQDVVQPKPLRLAPSSGPASISESELPVQMPALASSAENGDSLGSLSGQQFKAIPPNFTPLDVEAVLKAAQQRVAATN